MHCKHTTDKRVVVIVQLVGLKTGNCCLLKDLWVSSAVRVESNGWVRANVLILTDWLVGLTVDLCHLHSCHVLHCLHVSSHTHAHAYRCLSGCKEVENYTSQLGETCNFPQPRNTTLLREFYLATTQILKYTPTMPTHTPPT